MGTRAVTRAASAAPRARATTSARTRRVADGAPAADPTNQIEAVATELFIRNGYHGVSYLGIGKELGITHSNVHYYYRTKAALAEAVLKRVAKDTLRATESIWTDRDTTLVEKFMRMRDWTFDSYLRFNPDGKGGRPWGLLSRFSMEADALTPEMRQSIRATLRKLEDNIRTAVQQSVTQRELVADAPVEGITLQISSVMYLTGQLTRHASGFSRLDELLMWTITGLLKAYGGKAASTIAWPAVSGAGTRNSLSGKTSADSTSERYNQILSKEMLWMPPCPRARKQER